MSRAPLAGLLALALACDSEPTAPQAPTEAQSEQLARVDAGVASLRLKPDEEVWRRISWEADYETARERSEETDQPIFFFSMWGELDGRC
ncbi:MAG: hypothetical protein ACI8RZ_007609 [Myxococcota bacterium]|jgi:hypothetical protein